MPEGAVDQLLELRHVAPGIAGAVVAVAIIWFAFAHLLPLARGKRRKRKKKRR
jgi:hypothetical protein